jgi:hypothetical protein
MDEMIRYSSIAFKTGTRFSFQPSPQVCMHDSVALRSIVRVHPVPLTMRGGGTRIGRYRRRASLLYCTIESFRLIFTFEYNCCYLSEIGSLV